MALDWHPLVRANYNNNMLSAFEMEWGSRCDEDWIDIIDIILLNYLTISLGVVGSYVVYSPVVRV